MDVWKSLRIIRQRKWVFAVAALLALLAVLLRPLEQPAAPRYVSRAKVLFTPPAAPVEGVANGTVPAWFTDTVVLQELVLSEGLLNRVIDRLGLQVSWTELRSRVQMEPISGGRNRATLIQLSVTAESAEAAQRITSALVEEFIAYTEELSAGEFASTRQFLEELVAEAQSRLEGVEAELLAWQEAHGVASSEQAASLALKRRMELESRKASREQEASRLKAEVDELRAFLAGKSSTPPWSVLGQDKSSLDQLEGEVTSHRLKLLELQQVYTDENQLVREQKERLRRAEELYRKELARVTGSLLMEKEGELKRIQDSVAALEKQLRGKAFLHRKPQDELKRAQLQRQLEMWEGTYTSLMTQLYRARVAEQSSRRQGAISVLERPRPGTPTFAIRGGFSWKRLLAALPFCLIFGMIAALLADYLSASMKMQPRVEEALDVPVLGVIPRLPRDLAEEWQRLKRGEEDEADYPLNGRNRAGRVGRGQGRRSGPT